MQKEVNKKSTMHRSGSTRLARTCEIKMLSRKGPRNAARKDLMKRCASDE